MPRLVLDLNPGPGEGSGHNIAYARTNRGPKSLAAPITNTTSAPFRADLTERRRWCSTLTPEGPTEDSDWPGFGPIGRFATSIPNPLAATHRQRRGRHMHWHGSLAAMKPQFEYSGKHAPDDHWPRASGAGSAGQAPLPRAVAQLEFIPWRCFSVCLPWLPHRKNSFSSNHVGGTVPNPWSEDGLKSRGRAQDVTYTFTEAGKIVRCNPRHTPHPMRHVNSGLSGRLSRLIRPIEVKCGVGFRNPCAEHNNNLVR